MKKTLNRTKVRHQGIERKVEAPKDLRHIYSGEAQRQRLQRLHQTPTAPSRETREKAVENAIENLDGLRTRFTAEIEKIDPFGYGYLGKPEKRVLLKNVREIGTRKRLINHAWITSGKWDQHLGVGDVISFDARIKNRKLQYPRNVRLRTPANASHATQETGDSAIQIEIF